MSAPAQPVTNNDAINLLLSSAFIICYDYIPGQPDDRES